ANATSTPVTVYGNWGTLQVMEGGQSTMDSMGDQRRAPAGQAPAGQGGQRRPNMTAVIRAERQFLKDFQEANDGKTEVVIEGEQGPTLGDNWLDCMRTRESPVYNALRGYQVMVAISLGVESYLKGRVMAFDPVRQVMLPAPPPHKEFAPVEA
ncbi:MAG: hypothetical protein ACRD8O_07665, partial [Bryobacteraceae bacterium]